MTQKGVKLSIIVPVYNMAADGKLEYCLESLIRQNYQDFEVIAVDDASTDDSLRILQDYEQQYPHCFRALHLAENHRQGGAKNRGLELARGDYVGFVDSDDWIHPDMYGKLMHLAEATGADMVGCDYCLTNRHSMVQGQGCRNNREGQAGLLDDSKYKSLILAPGSLVVKVFARKLFEEPKLRFPEHIFYEDNAVSTTLVLRAKHFEYIDEPLYYYYQHASSTVHTISMERCFDRMKAMEYMLEMVRREGYLESYYQEIEYRFMNLFYENTLFTYMQGGQGQKMGFVRQLGNRMREAFPDFQRNLYYLEKVDPEGKKMMGIQQRSTVLFFWYYKMLHLARRLRRKL